MYYVILFHHFHTAKSRNLNYNIGIPKNALTVLKCLVSKLYIPVITAYQSCKLVTTLIQLKSVFHNT